MENVDIFDQLGDGTLVDTDTSFPILAPGQCEFRVEAGTVETSEKTGGRYLAFDLATTEDKEDINGRPLPAGYKVRHMISVTPTEKMDDESIKRNLAMFLDAVVDGRQWDPTLELYIGQTLFAKTKVQAERVDDATGETYPASARISTFIPKG